MPSATQRAADNREPLWPADAIEHWPLERIRESPRNARTHSPEQVEQIAESMREFGWANPVLVDETGELIAGHGRYRAAVLLGWTEARVMVARGWTEAQIRAYRIADNKIALNAGWDDELLASELAGLLDDGFDLGLTGFGSEELAALANAPVIYEAPEEFARKDETIATEHRCPKCGYEWSGKSQ
ncbi:ParB/Srx family N-terminal domain-containing protein [Paraburkholderia sp. EG304]|uniref:ParB/Srx family N-terminal domain-containing protein n=1 Tax=Paraburkholderia sp. EG304 TaxID=3237015 RepID=UPI00397ADCBC